MKEIIKNKAMINKTNIMHFQALLLQIVAVIITYTSGLEQVQYTVKLLSMEKKTSSHTWWIAWPTPLYCDKRDQRPKGTTFIVS